MAWFDGLRSPKVKHRRAPSKTAASLWTKCLGCNEILYRLEIDRNYNICPRCGYHFSISARRWIELLIDPETLVTVVRYIKVGSDFHRLARFLETYVE